MEIHHILPERAAPPTTILIPAPTSAGCPSAGGLREGPAVLLDRLGEHLQAGRLAVRWPELAGAAGSSVAMLAEQVKAAVAEVVAEGARPIVLGGDHTVALGSVLGVREGLRRRLGSDRPLYVLWIDAHPDVNTAETSPTGNLHGMVLSGLLGAGPLAIDEPPAAERVVLAGVRSFDPGELIFLQHHPPLAMWDVHLLRTSGWRRAAETLLGTVREASGWLYVSLDLDVLDPHDAPGVAVPARHGAALERVRGLLRLIAASDLLAGADVVELYPPADIDGRTAQAAVACIEALAWPAQPPRPSKEISSCRISWALGSSARLGCSSGSSRKLKSSNPVPT